MNRDEQRTRPPALPPHVFATASGQVLYPREPGGGTWIGLNDQGMVLALLNWYSAPSLAGPTALSRGTIIPRLLSLTSGDFISKELSVLALESFNSFRLLAILPTSRQVMEYAWNSHKLETQLHSWERRHWFSSGYREPEVARIRGDTANSHWHLSEDDSGREIRLLHSSHLPERGPFSICMHREDARTVSYTEITVDGHQAIMTYYPDSPCSEVPPQCVALELSASLIQ